MKQIIIAIMISSAVFFLSNQRNELVAESDSCQKMNPKEETDQMAQSLGLSSDQKAKVLAVNTAVQKIKILSANKEDIETMDAERKKIQQYKENKLKNILSVEQFQKYLAKKEEMKQQRE